MEKLSVQSDREVRINIGGLETNMDILSRHLMLLLQHLRIYTKIGQIRVSGKVIPGSTSVEYRSIRKVVLGTEGPEVEADTLQGEAMVHLGVASEDQKGARTRVCTEVDTVMTEAITTLAEVEAVPWLQEP